MRYVLILLLCLPALLLQAQGDAVISQYMLQPFLFNPAAAGSEGGLQAGALYRNQWGGLEGGPQNFLVQANLASKNERLGYGGWLGGDSWGPYKQHQLFGAFAYRIKAGKGHFSMGVQAGLQHFNTAWGDLTAFQAGDVTFTGNPGNNAFIPNFGAGLYYEASYESGELSAGISAPRMLSAKVFDKQFLTQTNYYTANFGYHFKFRNNFGVMPATLVKWTKSNAQVDLNLYVIYKGIWVGAGYRSDKSANFSAQYHLHLKEKDSNSGKSRRIIFAYSYDLANGKYRGETGSGTHEISLLFRLGKYMQRTDPTPENSIPIAP